MIKLAILAAVLGASTYVNEPAPAGEFRLVYEGGTSVQTLCTFDVPPDGDFVARCVNQATDCIDSHASDDPRLTIFVCKHADAGP